MKKNTYFKIATLFLAIPLLGSVSSSAQGLDDWEARPSVSLEYRFNKQLSLTGTYYLYIDKNITEIDKSVMAGEIGYKINSWLKAGFEYRYGLKNGSGSHDLRYSLTFDTKLSDKWKIKYRPMLQQEFVSLNKAELAISPVEYYLTNRLTAIYELAKAWDVYLFTENYVQLGQGDINFYRQKSALGLDYEIDDRNEVGTRFDIINKSSGKNIARINLSYKLTLGYIKSKQ